MKGYIVNIFGSGHHTASVTILQLCHFSTDRALEYVNEGVWPCSNKTSFTIAGGSGLDGPMGCICPPRPEMFREFKAGEEQPLAKQTREPTSSCLPS